ncbi:GHMP family kinase ATP-binding protein [Azospirillum melinis]
MIITRTPFRVSFFGGGTDYPTWYRRHGGRVLSTSIDKYCYITARRLLPFFNIRHRVVWSHVETVQSIDDILHPAVREGLKFLNFGDDEGIEIHHQGDLPARTGLGSSSSFAVGLILALSSLRNERPTKHELALRAIALEQDRLRDNVGSQDQVAVSYGGMNVIDFGTDGRISVTPLEPSRRIDELESHLMLFYTGMSRSASQVAADVIANLPQRERQLHRMRTLVDDAVAILGGRGELADFGRMLDETWRLKRQLSALVSNDGIDGLYARAMKAGAVGGKLLGAGTSGFMLFFVPPDRQPAVRAALEELLHVPFRFDRLGASLLASVPVPLNVETLDDTTSFRKTSTDAQPA